MKRLSLLKLVSPGSLFSIAVLIICTYAILHALGWREHVSIVSGTLSEAGGSFETQALQAGFYMCAYFGFTLLVPILLLAAALQILVLWAFLRR
ncbi:MAG: hypothetical protein IPK83_06020 [Planctomycetes bacterium]|nr:hypothetical protein [Planctomycetota bacterium]